MGDHNKLGILRQLMKILCIAVYIGIVQCRLDLIQQTERGRLQTLNCK